MFIKMPHQAFITFLLPALDHRFFAYCTCIICHDQCLSNLNNINHIPLFKSENIFQKHHWLRSKKRLFQNELRLCVTISFSIELAWLFYSCISQFQLHPAIPPPHPARLSLEICLFFNVFPLLDYSMQTAMTLLIFIVQKPAVVKTDILRPW